MAKYVKGLFKDTSPEDQPAGSWRYAKNITMHPHDGAISIEPGIDTVGSILNSESYTDDIQATDIDNQIFMGQVVIGSIEITDDRIILFLAYDWELIQRWIDVPPQSPSGNYAQQNFSIIWNNGNPIITSTIVEFDGKSWKILYQPQTNIITNDPLYQHPTDVDLNFNKNNFIEGTYKKNPDGDLFVYWTDNINPPRVMNITRQKEWLRSRVIQAGPNQGQVIAPGAAPQYLYGIDWTVTPNPRHKDLLNLFPASGPVPHVELGDINQGGGLLTGVYFLALAYVDQDLVQTNYVVVANPVSIVEDNEGVLPIERYDGAKAKSKSGKSISWQIFNINTDYEYVRPAVVRKGGGAAQAYQLNDIPTRNLVNQNNNGEFINNFITFTGLEGFKESSVADIIIDTVAYDTAKTINQLDGILYLGNLSGQKDLGYQKYANNIKLSPELREFIPFDPHEITSDVLDYNYLGTDPLGWDWAPGTNPITQGYRWNENIYKFKGYMRDEVYAFYIAFIMNDGTESYAYHIPGRAPLRMTPEQCALVPAWATDNSLFAGDGSQWESGDILNPGLLQVSDQKGRIFHFYETSRLAGAGGMNYWQNQNELYPTDVLNRDNWEIWDAVQEFINPDTYAGEGQSLSGRRVRHHHFPSNESYDGDNGLTGPNANTGFQVFGETSLTLTVTDEPPEWLALDFGWCSSSTMVGGESCADIYNDGGVTVDDLEAQGYDANTLQAFCDDLEDDSGGDAGDIIVFYDTYMPETAGNIWPNIGDDINYAFMDKGAHDDAQYAASYGANMYASTDGIMESSEWPGNWNGGVCSGWDSMEDSPYAQGGGWLGANFTDNTGGNDGADAGCNGVAEGGFYLWNPFGPDPWICTSNCNDGDQSLYWPVGCLKASSTVGLDLGTGYNLKVNNWSAGCGGIHSSPCHDTDGGTDCDTSAEPKVIWSNDTGFDNILVIARNSGSAVHYPWTYDIFFDPDKCSAFVWWQRKKQTLSGPINHSTRALGFSLRDVMVPPEIAGKTQGFRIYYALREHQDRRILGQNLMHPMIPTLTETYPQCVSASSLGDVELGDNTGLMADGVSMNEERYWINFPYQVGPNNFESTYDDREDHLEYQTFSFHDFYLLRNKYNITAATHFKVEYAVDMMNWAGPGSKNQCDEDPGLGWNDDTADNVGYPSCWRQCLSTSSISTGFQIALAYYNPTEIATLAETGATGSQTLYRYFLNHNPNTGGTGDLNRPLKERAKSYVRGDTVFNGKQMGFGYKEYNEFGESHISFMLHERHGILPCWENSNNGQDAIGVDHNMAAGDGVIYSGDGMSGTRRSMMYQGNFHAFRLDMYNSIDTQNLVWTGFQVVGEAYKMFHAASKSDPTIIAGVQVDEAAKYDTITAFEYFDTDSALFSSDEVTEEWRQVAREIEQLDQDGKIFGGDTYITRHGWRKTLRPNVHTEGGVFLPFLVGMMGQDFRYIYETVVESTDNINFRHVENKYQLYWPGSSIYELAMSDNLVDFTHEKNMSYNQDYSSVNDLGHTTPLPLQVSQPSNFPTRVVRSVKADDTSLSDSFRKFLPNQFNDLPKTRGDLWKISVFNNLLYFHMEDTILRTTGKQTMQMSDKSQAFIGSGDIFAQPPDELIQTDAGYGGTQSQFATAVTNYGYFCLNQRERQVYMITDKITNISSIGMEKWFQRNIPYGIEHYQAKPPADCPYTFGFTAVWDTTFGRILLTKRELVPTRMFRRRWGNGQIRYNSPDNHFYWTSDDPDEVGAEWQKLEYTYLPQTINNAFWAVADEGDNEFNPGAVIDGLTFFEPYGWTISFNPELNIWVSFHDDVSYKYSYIGEHLYSWIDFIHENPRNFGLYDNYYNVSWWGNQTYWHHPQTVGGNFVNIGSRFKHEVQAEFEVIHNESNDIDKLFYNFGFNVNVTRWPNDNAVINQFNSIDTDGDGVAETDIPNVPLDAVNQHGDNTQIHSHGFSHFILWNSHQCSGEREFQNLVNIRQSGTDWHVNHFRDISKSLPQTDPLFNNGQGFLPPNMYVADNPDLTAFIGYQTWIHSGMTEYLNEIMLDPTLEGRKFVDKWIAIRLICKQSQFFVNLLSTKVGARKYHRS